MKEMLKTSEEVTDTLTIFIVNCGCFFSGGELEF